MSAKPSIPWGPGLAVVAAVVLVTLFNAVFIVKETERAIMLRFGEIVRTDIDPGLHIRVPIMNELRFFDRRILTVDSKPERFLTKEKKFLEVDSFAQWRIENVRRYYTATNGEERRAHALLSQRINNGLRNQFGGRTMHQVVSGERDELMHELTIELNAVTLQEMGIEMIDVRVKGINLPPDVSESVYERMNTERHREAKEYRAGGMEIGEGIRADADRQRIVIEANAYRESQTLRGAGDAKATAIYAQAYQQDEEFFNFLRSLNAYRNSFADKQDIMVIESEGAFFNYFNTPDGQRK